MKRHFINGRSRVRFRFVKRNKESMLVAMAIEDTIDRRREQRLELSATMVQAHERAARILSDPEYGIQERDFLDVYGDAAVDKDLAEVARLQKVCSQNRTLRDRITKQISEVLEAIMLTQSELSNWLGDACTQKTAPFDDFKNKVDMVVEWPTENSQILSLAVDVTIGDAQAKFEDIRREIKGGVLGSIRYFKDSAGNFLGTRQNVPRVVVCVSQKMVEELAGLWIRNDKKKLGDHPIQVLILKEIKLQLLAMHAYAKKLEKHTVSDAYAVALRIINKLITEKSQVPATEILQDPVFEDMKMRIESIFRT